MPDLVGIGAINLDFILDSARLAALSVDTGADLEARFEHGTERAATEPEIRDVLRRVAGLDPVVSPGGSALNTVTVAARSCEVSVGYVGVCGRSPDGRFDFPAWFADIGIDTRHVRHSERTCGLCVSYTLAGKRSLLTWDGANDEIFAYAESRVEELLRYLGAARVVHVTSFAGGRDPAAVAGLLGRLRDAHPSVLISVDPGALWSIADRPPAVEALVELADVLLVNADEFVSWTDRPPAGTDLDAARRFFRDRPAMTGSLVLKGRNQVRIFERDAAFTVTNADVLDTAAVLDDTGAGDAFAAGFLSGIGVLGLEVPAAVTLGQRLAREQLQSVGMLGRSVTGEGL